MEKSRALARVTVGAIFWFCGSASAESITIEQALERAGRRPSVEMAGMSAEVARHEAAQAGRIAHNPEVSGGIGPRFGGEARTVAVQASLSQTVELGGKRGARRQVAAARAAAANGELRGAGLRARAEAWRAFQLALVTRERVAMAREAEQVAAAAAEATGERQKVGFATQLEVNLTTSEVGRARHDRLDAERKYEEALARLGSAIGAGGDEVVEPAGGLVTPPELSGKGELLARALRERPEAQGARAAAKVAEAEVRSADAAAVPDVTLGVSYDRERDPETVQKVLATAALELPLWNRNQDGRKAARAAARRAEREVAWTTAEIEREVRVAVAGYQRAREAVLGFDREVNERLHENLELARESYTSGKIDYFQFNVVRRELLASRNAYLDAVEETVEAWSAVQQATGGEVMP
jgi:outer membrane protein, heavy metal efflux system